MTRAYALRRPYLFQPVDVSLAIPHEWYKEQRRLLFALVEVPFCVPSPLGSALKNGGQF
jgi:hypothetical protein